MGSATKCQYQPQRQCRGAVIVDLPCYKSSRLPLSLIGVERGFAEWSIGKRGRHLGRGGWYQEGNNK